MPSFINMKIKIKNIPKKWYKNIIGKIKVLISTQKDFITIAKQFVIAVIAHGLIVNYMLWSLLGYDFSIITAIGYGVLIYLIKEEFVSFIRRIIFKR